MLIFEILKNRKLAARRSPLFERNRFSQILIYLGIAFWAAYLLFLGVMLPFAFREGIPNMEPYHILNKGLMGFLIIDFLLRFMQTSPVQEVKPYLLLPVSKGKVLSASLFLSAFRGSNLFWFFFFLPFSLLTVTRYYGIMGVAGYLLGIWLLTVMNSYWSMLIVVLKKERFIQLLWIIPVYGLLALMEFLPSSGWVSQGFMEWGEGFITWNPLAFLTALTGIAVLGFINFHIQSRLMQKEVAQVEKINVRATNPLQFLNRYGEVGEYLKLEVKLIFRNKMMRSHFWSSMFFMVLVALALSFEVYGEKSMMNNFVCLYSYGIMGSLNLNRIMSAEGNYIDGLLVRKESIYSLLRAKYYLQCLLLLIPFALNMIPVYKEVIPVMMSVSYLLFSAGVIFAAMMHVAIFNDGTIKLNETTIGKQNANMYQTLIGIGALTLPLLLNKMLTFFCNEQTAYAILAGLGLMGILTHTIWLKFIYRKMMKRKYVNLEGFRNTR